MTPVFLPKKKGFIAMPSIQRPNSNGSVSTFVDPKIISPPKMMVGGKGGIYRGRQY